MSVESEMIRRVRELHKPVIRSAWDWIDCEGCDFQGHAAEADYPDWPCRTAMLVYTDDERDAVTNPL